MEFTDVIQKRHAIRKYKIDPVEEEKLKKLYEALKLAPSGNNHQPYRFIFVRDAHTRMEIASKACHQQFLKDAPILMVACCDQGREFDAAIAVDHMMLEATNEGLGTCWVGWFERDIVRELLGIPHNLSVPILVPIGYADENPGPRPRKGISELIAVDRY